MPSVPGMGRKAVRKDDVRLAHAHLTRMIANNLPPGNLPDNVVSWWEWVSICQSGMWAVVHGR